MRDIPQKTTITLQKETLTPLECLLQWRRCIFELKRFGGDVANSLTKCLEGRERSLLETKVFLAGAWVDPRARVFLSEEQKVAAKRQLLLLNQRVKEVMGEKPAADAREEEITLDEDPDDFDALINNLAGSQNRDRDDAEDGETDEFKLSLLEVEKVRHLKERESKINNT